MRFISYLRRISLLHWPRAIAAQMTGRCSLLMHSAGLSGLSWKLAVLAGHLWKGLPHSAGGHAP